MKLVAIAALIAVCGAAKLDRTYLPPASASSAGGSSDSLQTPFTRTSEQADTSGNLPTGSYTNNFQGVVVDAAGAGTRASPEGDLSGLGGPRDTYGSSNSKVGDAAFRGSITGFRSTPFGNSGLNGPTQLGQVIGTSSGQNFEVIENKSERPQASNDRNSNIISYSNDVSIDNYSYGFETDNGIAVGENGVASNGIQAQGGYSYKGDDGQVYKVTYVADEGGYRPQGDHLPTPPPIPKEILESLEQNAKDEAAGLVDDGSYDAQKYNAEGDYMHHDGGNIQYNSAQSSQFAKRPESDATASNTFINQNSQALNKPQQFSNTAQYAQTNFNSQSNFQQPNEQQNQFGSSYGNINNGIAGSLQKGSSQNLNVYQESSSAGHQGSGQFGKNSGHQSTAQFGTQEVLGSQGSQFGFQNVNQTPLAQFGTQSSGFTTQTGQQGPGPQFGGQSQLNQQARPSALNSQSNQGIPGSGIVAQFNKPNVAFNSQKSQFGNQAYKPVGSFGSQYLPPLNSNNRPSYNKPLLNEYSTNQDSEKDNQAANFMPLREQNQGSVQGSSASSFASVGLASLRPQTVQPFNTFEIQPSRPNLFNNNNTQTESNALPISSKSNIFSNAELLASVKPTSIPNTELTTPLEPNEKPVFPQGSQLDQSNLNFENFGSQSATTQVQDQNSVFNFHSRDITLFDSSSTTPTIVPTTIQPDNGEKKLLSIQSYDNQNLQANIHYFTQKPSYNQGSDESYYYNQPSKPFGSPIARPQGSRFPNTPSYQPNSVVSSQSNQLGNQQILMTGNNQFSNSPSVGPVTPTPSSQFTPTQNLPINYNGITQASISPFPSIAPTTTTQDDSAQPGYFGSKPIVPSFPSKSSTFSQRPPSFFQNQNQFGQFFSNNNISTVTQMSLTKPASTLGQQNSTSLTQNQFTQSNEQPENSETPHQQETTTTETQQYEGTIYEYNKPPEVLPASEETDSSSSQSVQTDSSSKPQNYQGPNIQEIKIQLGSQHSQFGQNTFSPQLQQPSLNQGNKVQYGSQTDKPFDRVPLGQLQFGQNAQSSIGQQNHQGFLSSKQPNKSTLSTTTQYGQNIQTSFGSKPQLGSPSGKPIIVSDTSKPSQYKQKTQQQTQATQYGVQPFGGAQSKTAQFGQNTQTNFASAKQTNSGVQFNAQANKIFDNSFGQIQYQGSSTSSSQQNFQNDVKPIRPLEISSVQTFQTSQNQEFQGYPSSKPQFGTQLFSGQFTQESIQTSGAIQSNSQPTSGTQAVATNFDQSQLNQGSTQSTSSFGQQSFQKPQISSALKPQFGAQPQFNQNQNTPNKPYGSASSQGQFGLNTASSFAVRQPSDIQAYKPYGALTPSSQTQNKQFDQAPQTSQSVSATSSSSQFGAQPFDNTRNDGGNQVQSSQNNHSCCKNTPGSTIASLNVGKPSQAFTQTQRQFQSFQGPQGFNAQSLAGKGEEFGGPRKLPSFDAQTGYHY